MATVTGDFVYDFSGLADVNPYTNSDWSEVQSQVQLLGGSIRAAVVGTSVWINNAHVSSSPIVTARAEINQAGTFFPDPAYVGVFNGVGEGYIVGWDNTGLLIRKRYPGGALSTLTTITSFTFAAGDVLELEYEQATSTLKILINGAYVQSGGSVVSVTDTTLSGIDRIGVVLVYNNLNERGIVSVGGVGFVAADTTAPILSNGTSSAVSQTQIDGTFDTDTGEGTAYVLVSANATETVATVKASGAQQSVTATGTQNFSITGLTGGQQYYVHVVHTDVAGNDSTVLSIGPVTTQSATLQLQLSGIASVTGVQFDLLDGPVGSSNTLLISGTFDVAADGSTTIDLNSVSVTNGQTLEGIAVHPSTNDPIPLQGIVSIA